MSLNASNLFSVHGIVAVITGGGTGLGRTIALALDTNNAEKVLSSDVSIIPIVADITSQESLENAYRTVAAQTSHIDLLFANSGTDGPSAHLPPKPDGSPPTLTEFRDHHWGHQMTDFSETLNVNVTGTHYTILAFLPLLDEANKCRPPQDSNELASPRPQVIVTSSVSAMMNRPASLAYSFSKAALLHLVEVFAAQLAPYRIRVNGVAPGLFYSDLSKHLFDKSGVSGRGISEGSFTTELNPLTRAGSDEDIAGTILWMASRSGGYLNGETIVLDGGRTAVVR
ncbi:short chain dehydrogenase/reductase family [Aspergillus arachidicola]|uniref:Short chain dehydrogenase/reductase family n=1 Tax=Aspergillus arachidicola TaxID=656916 RepID=A0A2G7FPI7_9EURO|nr:short chain dehydrogenase/reductase family [Aspergillus arachidicola]